MRLAFLPAVFLWLGAGPPDDPGARPSPGKAKSVPGRDEGLTGLAEPEPHRPASAPEHAAGHLVAPGLQDRGRLLADRVDALPALASPILDDEVPRCGVVQ